METIYQSPHDEKERKKIADELKSKIGSKNVSTKNADRLSSSHGSWMIGERLTTQEKVPALPDAVVWPTNTKEVSKILQYANENKIPVIPYGGGSNVLGNLVARRGGISLDLKRMNELVEIDETNLKATAQAGMNGMNFEQELRRKGYTTGHSPQSLYCSAVGGWIATNATGQFSTKYGGIEKMLLGLEAVLPTGEIVRGNLSPRRSTGPEVFPLFIGSEGTLGTITEATLKIHPKPESRFLTSYVFDDIGDALKSVRTMMKRDLRPPVIRIYDKIETKRHFYEYPEAEDKVMTVFVIEGNEKVAQAKREECEKICSEYGQHMGEDPVEHWLETRFDVSETSRYPQLGIIFDTIEVSCDWNNAESFYRAGIEAMESVDGSMFASAHASHFYPQGVCFYFTFGGIPPKEKPPLDFYQEVWDAAMKSFLKNSGHISHHHGIGLNRSEWFSGERKGELDMLKKMKEKIDPNNIMNPGLFKLKEGE